MIVGILSNIILAPIKLPCFIAKKTYDMAMNELLGEDKIREELKELYKSVEEGKISEEEFEEREEELVDLLEEAISYRQGKNT